MVFFCIKNNMETRGNKYNCFTRHKIMRNIFNINTIAFFRYKIIETYLGKHTIGFFWET